MTGRNETIPIQLGNCWKDYNTKYLVLQGASLKLKYIYCEGSAKRDEVVVLVKQKWVAKMRKDKLF